MKTTNFKMLCLTTFATLILTLTGCDKSGTPSDAEGLIGLDRTVPVVTLLGDTNITLDQGDTYIEAGATAVDNVDGPLAVVITGTVDTSTIGIYTLTYTAVDSSANESSVIRTVNVVTAPLDENITINNAALQTIIASIYDNTPYNPAINVQGVINVQGLTVSIPYTVTSAPVLLSAYSTSVTLDASVTEDDETGIVATFSWPEQNLAVGSGTFTATIDINDSAGNQDNVYKAKKLDIDNIEGLVATTFPYALDSIGSTGTLTLKIMPGIPDRMFGVADNNGDTTSHMFLYMPVTNPTTGKTWLNNNLGASYANVNSPTFDLTQQATTSRDHNAYGSLFQWGRKADGHELITWTDSFTGTAVNGSTSTLSDSPTDALFITGTDWRLTPNDTLWDGEAAVNSVCPVGYRVPTRSELDEERSSWGIQNAAGALAGTLVFPMVAYHRYTDGILRTIGGGGWYWSSDIDATTTYPGVLYFSTSTANMYDGWVRGYGFSVRCIKD